MRETLSFALLFVLHDELMATDWSPETLCETKRGATRGQPSHRTQNPELRRVLCYAQLFAGSLTPEYRFEGDSPRTFNNL